MKSIPLRYVQATKPTKSPITPPPKAMITSFLLTPSFVSAVIIFDKLQLI